MDKTTKQSIEHLCSAWTDDNGIELEANVTDRVLRFQFRKCMAAVMRQWGRVKEEPEVMDVSVVTEKTYRGPQIRYSIVGKAEIAAYCRTNKLAGIEFSQFKHRMGSCDAGQYGFKVKLSKENMERVPPNINVEIHDSLKLFRLKKRYSVPAGDSGFRVDFTIVKSTRAKNLATAQLQQEPEKYEIEVEYIGSDQPSAEAFVEVIERVMCALKDDVHLIAAPEKERVVDFYAALTGKGRAFIGPKPVTLEHQHVGGLSLDYSVTEKADGDRALLVFDATGLGFLLNNRMEVRGTNLVSKLKSTILDVEVVTKINGARLILAFDCYWSNEVPVWNSKTLLERLDLANHAIKNTNTTKSKYELRAKHFYTDGNAATKRILDKIARAEFDYVTDGLVFTPVSAAVGETRAKPSPSLGGTWAAVYKWKEPRDNTIDVLVEECVAQGHANAKASASFNIFVGSVRATVETYFGGTANNDAFVKYRFVPRGAPETMDVPLDSAGVAKCANGEEIRDKYIVEVGFDLEAKMWKPLRIRHDKIEESKRTGALTANALNPTAASVWRTVTNPVTRDQVTGAAPIAAENLGSSAENDDDEYYKGHGTDRTKEIYALREFHNYWVKGVSLLNRFNGHATKLFDVSCGQGGDLNRWVTNGFTTVVGVDKAEGGIVNEKDGAYSRLIKRDLRPPHYKYVFIPLDSSRAWAPQIPELKDEFMKKVAQVAWGLDPSPLQSIRHLEGIAASPTFDLVSCQFSLHYFFENEKTLEGLIANINSVLAPGGHFIGTCFDAERVVDLLGSADERTGRNDIWKIRKGWTGAYKKNFGQAIDVYVESIDKWHREYLVPYDLLVKRLAKSGIRPMTASESVALGFGGVSTGSFQDLYKAMENSGDASHHVKNALKLDDNEDERTFSFLNMWFVFVKDFKKPKAPAAKKATTAA